MKKKIRLLSCLIISVLMLVMVVPKRVFADEGPINLTVTDPSKNVDDTGAKKHGDVTGEDAVILQVVGEGTKIHVDAGNATASDDGVTAVAYNGGEIKTNVEKIEAGGAGVFAKAVSTDSTVDVTAQNVTGNNEYGIYAAVEKGGSAEVTAETIKSENSTGVVFTADNNEKSNIKIKTGSIESDSDGIYGSAGLASDETGGSSVTVETGSITSENGNGIVVDSNYGDTININVNGDITAGSADYLKGTYAYAGENANLSVVATGTISGSIGADISGDGANTLSVQAKEIKGDNIGVFLYIRGESDSNAIVTADTISGKNVSIGLSNYGGDQSNKNSTIIAWKIELNNRGNVAENADLETLEAISVNKNFELNNILYLLKIEQPAEGGTISLESDDESVEETGLANETAKVYVKVNIQEGYAVAGVYNGKDEKKLISKDDKGYYIVVPKGGGVYLTADIGPALKIIDETKDPHEIGGGQSHFVEVNANINDFKQVILDNVDVTKHATVTEGSTIVTFDPSFLDTLSVGEHDLMLKFRIGIASTKLRVIDNNPDNNPSSDSNNTGFAIPKTGIEDMQKTSSAYKGYMIASFAVAAAIVTFKRNRKNLVK